MTSEELKNAAASVLEKPYHTQLYFILKVGDELIMRLADIEDKNTVLEIQRMFVGFVNNTIISNDNIIIRSLSVADELPNAIYEYDYESYPEELDVFKKFSIETAVKSEKFNFKTDNLSQLFGYIIYLGSMENGIVLFKHYSISLIKRDSFLLGAIKSAERFEKLPGEDIIRLNDSIQLVRINEVIFVLDLQMLERNMGFSALIQKAASETVEAIQTLEILDDIQVLKDALCEPAFSRKLSRVKKSSPIFKLGITKEAIIEFTKTTPELAGKFKYSDDGYKIRLDTKKSKDAFLKLMNDSFLRSELTKQYYEASTKDNITQASN